MADRKFHMLSRVKASMGLLRLNKLLNLKLKPEEYL